MTPRAPNPPLAALLTLLAAAFVAGTTLLAKALGTGSFGSWDLGPPLHPLQISQGRFLFALIAILAFVALA
ncbi:MAG: EamA/RhaT family transporter, partial [Pseudomonadota bacterium]